MSIEFQAQNMDGTTALDLGVADQVNSVIVGEVVAFAQSRRFPQLPHVTPWPAVLFLPLSVICSGGNLSI